MRVRAWEVETTAGAFVHFRCPVSGHREGEVGHW